MIRQENSVWERKLSVGKFPGETGNKTDTSETMRGQ